jgi:hypothetical protein
MAPASWRPCPMARSISRRSCAFLEEKGFDGPVVVEQDIAQNATETPLQLAKRNLDYVNGIIA